MEWSRFLSRLKVVQLFNSHIYLVTYFTELRIYFKNDAICNPSTIRYGIRLFFPIYPTFRRACPSTSGPTTTNDRGGQEGLPREGH